MTDINYEGDIDPPEPEDYDRISELEAELAEVSRKQAQAEQDAWDKGWQEGCHEGGKHAMQRVQEVEAELAEARREIQRLKEDRMEAESALPPMQSRIRDLEAEVYRKDTALRMASRLIRGSAPRQSIGEVIDAAQEEK